MVVGCYTKTWHSDKLVAVVSEPRAFCLVFVLVGAERKASMDS